jgi:hypothetical protein
MLLAGDHLVVVAAEMGYNAASCPGGAAVVEAEVRALLSSIAQVAGELDGEAGRIVSMPSPSTEALRSAAVDCMRRAGDGEDALRGAIAVVIAGEWLQNLARFVADIGQPVRAAEAAAAIHWWR